MQGCGGPDEDRSDRRTLSSGAASGAADLGSDRIELDLLCRLENRDVTHLRYRVRRPGGAA